MRQLGECCVGVGEMRGGMAGSGVDEKENTPVRGTEKKGKERRRSSAGSGRRLSISGSKPRLHYLRVTNRFQRKGGFGRGRITAHRPVQFDGSPYEFSLRYLPSASLLFCI